MNLQELNDSQREAVLFCDGPSLVIAGAGSGKTRVLTYKIAWLLEQGLRPWNILALTFTNKAAREMRERIGRLVGEEMASGLWMGTFHSIFARILRYESAAIGYNSDFTIYDAADSKSLIKTIIREQGLDDKKYKPGVVQSRISNAKNALMMPDRYQADGEVRRRDESQMMDATGHIYAEYCRRCRASNAMDFDDLLVNTWRLLSENPAIADKYQQRFEFVLVDEYQDTNYAQHQIVELLTSKRQRVCVVGDDAQSIYSFRGANIDNILKFRNTYTAARLFKLEQNYRSTQTIVNAANSLIHHNQRQIQKEVFSKNDAGTPILVCTTSSDKEEAYVTVRKINDFNRREHIDYQDIAILYRTNAQSRSFEEVLRKAAVPYRIYGGLSFYQRKEVKDVIAYYRLAVNLSDEEALRRIINVPARGIGATTLDKVFTKALQENTTAWEVLTHTDRLDVNNGLRNKLNQFVSLMTQFHEQVSQVDAHTLGMDIIGRSGLQAEIFTGHEPEDISRQENLQEMMDAISSFVEEQREEGKPALLTNYLQEVSLLTDLDEDKTEGDNKVTLMTVHAAKGLEFRVVFVVGLEEDLFPSQMNNERPAQLEEERRLMYVAMTRAKEHLILSNARSRIRFGQLEYPRPSRFLAEIDSRYLRADNGRTGGFATASQQVRSATFERTRFQPVTPQPVVPGSRFSRVVPTAVTPPQTPASNGSSTVNGITVKVGDEIMHQRFGKGEITRIEGSGMDTKATVDFENVGTKQLLLRFARFQVIR